MTNMAMDCKFREKQKKKKNESGEVSVSQDVLGILLKIYYKGNGKGLKHFL